MDNPDDRIDLLLAAADDGRPVLEDGLPGEATRGAKKPRKTNDPGEAPTWRRDDADPNDLHLQGWGLVVPEGPEGKRQLEALKPLLRLREQEQGKAPRVYFVPPEMDMKQAVAWKEEVYWSEDEHDEDRPLYLLMLGDLRQTSVELQHAVANEIRVGRVHFANAEGKTDLAAYGAYAEKVVRYARDATPETSPDFLLYVAEDGTPATIAGKSRLVDPSLEASEKQRAAGRLTVGSVRTIEASTVDDLLVAGAGARPSVLLSVSHGLGAPRRGWASVEEQQRRQGALVIRHDEILDAERMRGQPFLPGGMWFLMACFGAGTPGTSVYYPWLTQLAQEGAYQGSAGAVLRSLPAPEDAFVAAMPQAALANPAGPLSVVSHLDLAWTYGFSGVNDLSESRKGRMLEPLFAMLRDSRAGVALGALMRFYRDTNDTLMQGYQADADARANNRPSPVVPRERAHLWMLRNDLRGYVLLGDPAARLPLRDSAFRAPEPAPPEVRSAPAGGVPATFVLEVLRGDEAPRAIANRHGMALDTLWKQVAAVLAVDGGGEAPEVIAARAGLPLDTLWASVDAYRAERRQGSAG